MGVKHKEKPDKSFDLSEIRPAILAQSDSFDISHRSFKGDARQMFPALDAASVHHSPRCTPVLGLLTQVEEESKEERKSRSKDADRRSSRVSKQQKAPELKSRVSTRSGQSRGSSQGESRRARGAGPSRKSYRNSNAIRFTVSGINQAHKMAPATRAFIAK